MKQVAQRARDGAITVLEVPPPAVSDLRVLVETRCSLISAGTERAKVETGHQNLLAKARSRPDLTRKVIQQARTQGIRATAAVVRDRLDTQSPIGYSSSGVVRAVGAAVSGIQPGDRVACGGAGWANHAELVNVPANLVAKVPDGVDFESAAYATVASIAMHGVRQSRATLGECVGVIGLGLVGQLTIRLLRAAGCAVVGVDVDAEAAAVAATCGASSFMRDDPQLSQRVMEATRGIGLDAVIVCAATRSSDPIRLAGALARDRGRVVIVGDVHLEADRAEFYEKELELILSRSYGPGRYDVDYEERGRDLPPGYVRWTEQRNLVGFLDLVAQGDLEVKSLTTHRYPVDQAEEAYATLLQPSGSRAFGIILEYVGDVDLESTAVAAPPARRPPVGTPRIGFIGAGNFARGTLLPAFAASGSTLAAIASASGIGARDAADRFGIARCGSVDDLIAADDLDALVISTRHDSHAALVVAALNAGKAVFVEKPLALSIEELSAVEHALDQSRGLLMVGFNRRYARLLQEMRDVCTGITDKVILARVNAGALPPEHWLHDLEIGGGRLLGEACHFVDTIAVLAGAPVADVYAFAVPQPERSRACSDSFVATLRMANGAVGSLTYSGGGSNRLPKERFEMFGGGVAAVLDDFKSLEVLDGKKKRVSKGAQDKGHRAEVAAFTAALRGEGMPLPLNAYLNTTRATFALAESLRTGHPVVVNPA